MKGATLPTETVFVMEMSPIKFGLGAMEEIGFDARRLGIGKALIFTDRRLAELGLAERVRTLLGTLKQPRLLAGAPRAVGAAELDQILRDSMRYW